MSREAFLARVREAAIAGRAYRVHLHDVPAGTGYVGTAGRDPCEALRSEIVAVGGRSAVVNTDAEALETLSRWLDEFQPKSALVWQHCVLAELGLREFLANRQIAAQDYDDWVSRPRASQREAMFAADVGITSVEWAIAETGSLVMCARPGRERVASLLPPVHIAIVRQSQIVPDLFDVFGKVAAHGLASLPSHLTLITGPSKTGDIELQLTTGVHGPGEWRVLVIREGSAP